MGVISRMAIFFERKSTTYFEKREGRKGGKYG
jgi:hypothetical protein